MIEFAKWKQCLKRGSLVTPDVNKNDVIRGQAGRAKKMSPEGKVTTPACPLTKK